MFLNSTKVTEVLQNLKRKSGGNDGIHAYVLKLVTLYIASVLAHIINNIMVQGSCPYEECPVFKKRSKNDKNNYRLIALIFNLAKIFEKSLYFLKKKVLMMQW